MSTSGNIIATVYRTKAEPVKGTPRKFIPCPAGCGREWKSKQAAEKCCREVRL